MMLLLFWYITNSKGLSSDDGGRTAALVIVLVLSIAALVFIGLQRLWRLYEPHNSTGEPNRFPTTPWLVIRREKATIPAIPTPNMQEISPPAQPAYHEQAVATKVMSLSALHAPLPLPRSPGYSSSEVQALPAIQHSAADREAIRLRALQRQKAALATVRASAASSGYKASERWSGASASSSGMDAEMYPALDLAMAGSRVQRAAAANLAKHTDTRVARAAAANARRHEETSVQGGATKADERSSSSGVLQRSLSCGAMPKQDIGTNAPPPLVRAHSDCSPEKKSSPERTPSLRLPARVPIEK